mmetsp:Transcript_27232/g.61543  ORF Transcript_27232/g.61543 Transcript_27232/m.61543 type:complete len:85 (-) Transcript_27232:19-273(-)
MSPADRGSAIEALAQPLGTCVDTVTVSSRHEGGGFCGEGGMPAREGWGFCSAQEEGRATGNGGKSKLGGVPLNTMSFGPEHSRV